MHTYCFWMPPWSLFFFILSRWALPPSLLPVSLPPNTCRRRSFRFDARAGGGGGEGGRGGGVQGLVGWGLEIWLGAFPPLWLLSRISLQDKFKI